MIFDYEREINNENSHTFFEKLAFAVVITVFIIGYLFVSTMEYNGLL